MSSSSVFVSCAGGVVRDTSGRVLVIRRAHPPDEGRWSLPGGRLEPSESAAQAAVREVREETGLVVKASALLGRIQIAGQQGSTYLVDDFVCQVVGGELRAGGDAADARWVSVDELRALACTPRLLETLEEWGALS